jgi:flagellar protein FlgJ
MVAPSDLSTRFALDVQAVNGLRVASGKNGDGGLEAAARQFEALFLGMMLKSMREATSRDSLLDSEQSRMYMSMLDQQLSQSMAARGVGLAEMMMRQLRDGAPPEAMQLPNAASPPPAPVDRGPGKPNRTEAFPAVEGAGREQGGLPASTEPIAGQPQAPGKNSAQALSPSASQEQRPSQSDSQAPSESASPPQPSLQPQSSLLPGTWPNSGTS